VSVPKANKRGFVRFQSKTGRQALTREQFEYWMDFLPKILKVGTEFEINLPDSSNILGKENAFAPCVSSDQPCFNDCANLETCLVDRHPALCLTRSTGTFLGEKFACPAKSDADTEARSARPSRGREM